MASSQRGKQCCVRASEQIDVRGQIRILQDLLGQKPGKVRARL